MAKILLIEDDVLLAEQLRERFLLENHVFEIASTGEVAASMLERSEYDVLIIDWTLPGVSGLDVCRNYKRSGGTAGIIFLTGISDIPRKSIGLDSGADDYLTKPFDVRELVSRVRSILRRPRMHASLISLPGVELNLDTRALAANGKVVILTPRESELMSYLIMYPNQTHSCQQLLKYVWRIEDELSEEAVRMCIVGLRQHLSEVGLMIETISGEGYRFAS